MSLHPPYREAAEQWLDEDPDPQTREQLQQLIAKYDAGDTAARDQLREMFHGSLEFGTAGLRGILGPGPQGMNRVLVRKVTAGLAAYLHTNVADVAKRGVLIGYDGRHNSRVFAEDTARVLAGAGIPALLAHRPWPTPTTAWAVGDRDCAAGVMVTASHNPPAYNGYKVYWGNGAQIIAPHDAGIAAAVAKIGRSDQLPMPELDEARRDKLVIDLDEALHDRYLAAAIALREQPLQDGSKLAIAFTPMHGVGARSTEPIFARTGYANVHTVPEQREPDPDFPTVAFPNPEEKGAMDLVLALAREINAELVLANDPDADRLAVAVPDPASPTKFRQLTGDQVGALFADYLLEVGPKGKRMVATTIVSSQLLSYLAKAPPAGDGADYRETLTGFKWIGNAAMDYERATHGRFVMGYEEALGYSIGPLVRDKDGVSACLIFADLVLWNRARGRNVLDHLDDIYRRVGLFVTEQVSITKPGSEGIAEIKKIMERVRKQPPKDIAGHEVEQVVDLAKGEGGLPASDVLVFKLEGGRRVIMRPSGTEPKLKSYYEVRVPVAPGEAMETARSRGTAELAELRDTHQRSL
ncbi:MAG: phospho-sugar mutase [Deltaproteobacteria bacterium]